MMLAEESGSSGSRTGVQLIRLRTTRTRTPRRMLPVMVSERGLSRGKKLACPCPIKEWAACLPLARQPCPPQLGLQPI